jgi:hypothetical protein
MSYFPHPEYKIALHISLLQHSIVFTTCMTKELHGTESLGSQQLFGFSRIVQHFMEPEG